MEDSYGSGVEDLSSAAAEPPTRAWRSRRNSRRRCDASEASRWATASASACDRARPTPSPSSATTTPPLSAARASATPPAQTPPTTEDTHLRTLRTDDNEDTHGEPSAVEGAATGAGTRAATGDGAESRRWKIVPGRRLRLPSSRRTRRGEAKRTPRGHGRRLPYVPQIVGRSPRHRRDVGDEDRTAKPRRVCVGR